MMVVLAAQTARLALALQAQHARKRLGRFFRGFYHWLDVGLFPKIVAFATHRLHILFLLGLGVALMLDADPLVQLKLGNYTNITSALVAVIVLLQSLKHHAENRQMHAANAEQIARLHARQDAVQDAVEAHQAAQSAVPTSDIPPPVATAPVATAPSTPKTRAARRRGKNAASKSASEQEEAPR